MEKAQARGFLLVCVGKVARVIASRGGGGLWSRQQAGPVPQAAGQEHPKDVEVGAHGLVQQPVHRAQNGGVSTALGRQVCRPPLSLQSGADSGGAGVG